MASETDAVGTPPSLAATFKSSMASSLLGCDLLGAAKYKLSSSLVVYGWTDSYSANDAAAQRTG